MTDKEMANEMRDRLVELIYEAGYDYELMLTESRERGMDIYESCEEYVAYSLIKNGVVPVVRCKNCKFYEPYKKPVEDFDGECIARDCETDETDFCNYGERKCEE